MAPTLAVGVLALQGAFAEHINLLQKAGKLLAGEGEFDFLEVRTEDQLSRCDALIIPGGESTTLSLVAERSGLLEPLREFVKVDRKPTWGTCAGLILLAEAANATKKGGQDLIGGLDVRVHRNHFGRQNESFEIDLDLPFLGSATAAATSAPFHAIFIRAPIVDKVLPHVQGHQAAEAEVEATVVAPSKQPKDDRAANAVSDKVDVLAVLPERSGKEAGDIVAVRQGNCFGTSFHPELTEDARIHVWWLRQVLQSANGHADSTR